jgi:hypothetical protein
MNQIAKMSVITIAVGAWLAAGAARAADVDPSMVLYMPFDNVGADVATDFSSFGNHGELMKGAEITEEDPIFFGSLLLEPSAHVVVQGHDSLSLQDMTLMFWVRFDGEPDAIQNGIERTAGWGAGEYNLNGDYNGGVILQIFDLDDGCDDELQVGNVVDFTWHHVAASYDSSEIVIYIDGDDVGGGPCEGEIAKVATPLYIGARGGSGRFTQGAYDEIRMYNRVLDKDEIAQIMAEGPVELLAVDPRDRAAVTWGTLKTGVPALHE